MRTKMIVFLLVLGGTALAWLMNTSALTLVRGIERTWSGLTQYERRVGRHEVAYLAGGEGLPVLLLHGFAADKDNWTRMARYVTDAHYVVAPDLPGHGESSQVWEERYDVSSQVERVKALHDALDLGRVHLVGNSMGGQIASVYASRYPQDVASLALLCPAGVTSSVPSELSRRTAMGDNPLIVRDRESYTRLLEFVFVQPPFIPSVIVEHFARQAVAHASFHDKIWNDLHVYPHPLEPLLPSIDAPTLVLWGEQDRVLHPSGAQVFERGLRSVTVEVLDATGHTPMIERPKLVGERLRRFWDVQTKTTAR